MKDGCLWLDGGRGAWFSKPGGEEGKEREAVSGRIELKRGCQDIGVRRGTLAVHKALTDRLPADGKSEFSR